MTTPPTSDDHDRAVRRRAIRSAIASQEIEGLSLDERATADFQEFEEGTLSIAELRHRFLARYSRVAKGDHDD